MGAPRHRRSSITPCRWQAASDCRKSFTAYTVSDYHVRPSSTVSSPCARSRCHCNATCSLKMNVRFGVSPIAWFDNALAQLSKDMTLEVCLAQAREAGFSGIESGIRFFTDQQALGTLLERFELALVCGWFPGSLLSNSVAEEKARMQAHVAAFNALGARVLAYTDASGSIQSR